MKHALYYVLHFFRNYATDIAFYVSMGLVVVHPSSVSLGFATLSFGNFMHQRHCNDNIEKLKQVTEDRINALNAMTADQIQDIQKSVTDMGARVAALQVQKQITGRPAVSNPTNPNVPGVRS